MKFFIKNFGCRTNTSEAEEWVERLSESGYKFTPSILEADVLIVNSCVITKTAENEVKRLINKIKREKPSAHVIITGCLTDSLRLNSEFHIIENDRKKEIPQKILERFGKAGDCKGERLRVRGNLKIQEGCNFRCAFCIVPFVRGKARSVPEEEILERAKELANKGFKELVIAGTHLNSWGIDLNPR
ncbi:MAG: radical SAM protein, partial [Candidatus Aminicenantia bacterium]